jgi:hypothetical protein
VLWMLSTVVQAVQFVPNQHFLSPPDGADTIGDSHGDIAVSPTGEIYVSVQGGARKGLQVYSPRGQYLRNVPNAPEDLHGFIITRGSNGNPDIFGARVDGQEIVEITLDGKPLLTIPPTAIPDRYKSTEDGKLFLSLTGVAVAPNGDIYAVDGYGRDFIHRFDKTGHYLGSFGGDEEPWNFKQCHKIAIDPRFTPVRILCTDRLHDRLIAMNLDGQVIGVVAQGLNWPSAMAFYRSEMAVAEAGGRVTILSLNGTVITTLGENKNSQETKTNTIPPSRWRPDLFYAPHGITYDASGNLLITEWSQWGRVVRLERK